MPACPRDNQCSSLPPPGFAEDNTTLKRVRLIDSLEKLIEKCQREPQFIEQQPKETDLLLSIAQFVLLSPSTSHIDRRISFDNILAIGKDLLTDEDPMNNKENNNSSSIEIKDMTTVTVPLLPSTPPNNDDDGDFSLDDLANEYLRNDPSPPSSNEKEKFRAETNESDSIPSDVNKTTVSSAPENDILSKLFFAPIKTEPLKPQLESILFSNLLSVHDDDDCMWKEQSSQFGEMFCSKPIDVQTKVTKRISTCLLDRSLYERLTRLVTLLPKECIRTSSQQFSVRPNNNGQQYRPQRSNNDNRRSSNRPSFQQNSLQMFHNQRFPSGQNIRQHMNPNYSNQNSSATGYFVDRRSQQQNRYPPAPYPNDHQPRGAASKHNPHSGSQHPHQQQQQQQQQKKKNPSNDNQQAQRGSKKGQGGNKFNNEKPGMPGSGPNANPK